MNWRPWKWSWRYRPDGRPRLIWAERWNAPIYALILWIGVPILGWSGLDEDVKWRIAAIWFGFSYPLYIFFEGRELTGQMAGRGSIDAPQQRRQTWTAILPMIGAGLAFVVWLVTLASHRFELAESPIVYGWVEATIILQAFFAIPIAVYVFPGLGMELLKSAPRGERAARPLGPPR